MAGIKQVGLREQDMSNWRDHPMLPPHVELCQRVFDDIRHARRISPGSDADEPVAALVLALFRHGVRDEQELHKRVLQALDERS